MATDEVVARSGRSPWLTRILLLAASLVVTFVVVRVIGKISGVITLAGPSPTRYAASTVCGAIPRL